MKDLYASLALCVLLVLAGRPGLATPPGPESEWESESTPAEVEGIAYETRIDGELDDTLRQLLEQSSILISLADRPPPSKGALNRRLEEDRDRFQRTLRSQGFYAGQINTDIDDTLEPWRITIEVVPGEPFVLDGYNIEFVGPYRDAPRLPGPPKRRGQVRQTEFSALRSNTAVEHRVPPPGHRRLRGKDAGGLRRSTKRLRRRLERVRRCAT